MERKRGEKKERKGKVQKSMDGGKQEANERRSAVRQSRTMRRRQRRTKKEKDESEEEEQEK